MVGIYDKLAFPAYPVQVEKGWIEICGLHTVEERVTEEKFDQVVTSKNNQNHWNVRGSKMN